jgi:hypothetical protein
MPYELTDVTFSELFQRCSKDQDIAESLLRNEFSGQTFIEELKKKKESYSKVVSKHANEYLNTENKIFSLNRIIWFDKNKPASDNLIFQIFALIFACASLSILIFYILGKKWESFQDIYFGIFVFACGEIVALIIALYLIRRVKKINNNKKTEYQHYLHEIEEQIVNHLVEREVGPYLREYINQKNADSFRTKLALKKAPGLWTSMEPSYEIPTETKLKIERMLKNFSTASIGLAGPRGAGKSTLLSSICDPDRKEFNKADALTIMTSVPVKYDAKEFILHLYSLLCEKILEVESIQFHKRRYNQAKYSSVAMDGFLTIIKRFSFFIKVCFILGFSGILLSIFEVFTSKTNSIWTVLQITNALVFRLSIILFFPGFIYLIYVVLELFKKIFGIGTKKRNISNSILINLANDRLEEIKFQQNYTSGWSGSVLMPNSIRMVESTSSFSYAMNRNPLSLPEIIRDYKDFVTHISTNSKVYIAIDELDKISSSEAAQQFLNEIKAIFGIRNCYYLVSISDNALSNFERRGIALRDEFDTSFDQVLFLDTPDIGYALSLLRKRVIGLPLPFVYLCYVVSGGLPRDIIRICRELHDFEDNSEGYVSLDMICKKIISRDLISKIRAISIAASEGLKEPYASEIFSILSQTDIDCILRGQIPKEKSKISMPIDTDAIATKAKKLEQELLAYSIFAHTVYIYFNKMSKDESISPLSKSELKSLEKLAKAKLLITSSPNYAISEIKNFCKSKKIF